MCSTLKNCCLLSDVMGTEELIFKIQLSCNNWYLERHRSYLLTTFTFHNLLCLHNFGWRYCRCQRLQTHRKKARAQCNRMQRCEGLQGRKALTSAFKSERIRTTHLWTAIWKVKLITPLIFNKASSQRFLRDWKTNRSPTTKKHTMWKCSQLIVKVFLYISKHMVTEVWLSNRKTKTHILVHKY